MGDHETDAEGHSVPFPSSEPDTEPADPPTPQPATLTRATPVAATRASSVDSIDVSVEIENARAERASGARGSASTTPKAVTDPSNLATTARSRTRSRAAAQDPPQDSNTTLQSMMKPDASNAGVPHTRRFLRLENDLDQVSVTLKLVEKGLTSARKEARVAWIMAICALLVAALAVAL